MPSSAWKDLERRVCRMFGANRRPSVGRDGWARGTDDDGTAPFAIECKKTRRLQLRSEWIAQARRNAKADGRPWLLVIEAHRGRAVAVLDLVALAQVAERAGIIDPKGEGMSEQQDQPQPPSEPDEKPDAGIPEQYEEGGPTHKESADEREDDDEERVEKT